MTSATIWSDVPLPLRRVDGYLPIEDHGLVGDGTTAALVGRDGTVSWLCVPRFDGRPLFCGILAHRPHATIRAPAVGSGLRRVVHPNVVH